MLCVVLLRILGSITLCMLSWDQQLQACYLFTEDPRQSYKSSNMLPVGQNHCNMLQVGQIKHCKISFLGAYSTCCINFFWSVCGCLLTKRGEKRKEKKKELSS